MKTRLTAALAALLAAVLFVLASCAPGEKNNGGTAMDTTNNTVPADTAAENIATDVSAEIDALLSRITVNEQSSIRIGTDKVIYFDPFRIKDAPHDADYIFITHAHYDHFSPEDIAKVRKADTAFICPESMQDDIKGLDVIDGYIIPLIPGGALTTPDFEVLTVPAYNTNKKYHPKANGWLGYIVTIDGVRLYVAGDTDVTDEAKAVECDIAMLPIGGTYTMTAQEAKELVKILSPAAAIPTHYGTVVGKPSDYDTFADGLDCAVKKLVF